MIPEYSVGKTGAKSPEDVAASVRISGVPERWLRHGRVAEAIRTDGDGKGHDGTWLGEKPAPFQVACVTAGEVSYSCCDGQMNSTFSGGVLPRGKKVWTATEIGVGRDRALVAYVEGVGTVRIDGRTLRFVDGH